MGFIYILYFNISPDILICYFINYKMLMIFDNKTVTIIKKLISLNFVLIYPRLEITFSPPLPPFWRSLQTSNIFWKSPLSWTIVSELPIDCSWMIKNMQSYRFQGSHATSITYSLFYITTLLRYNSRSIKFTPWRMQFSGF